MSFSRGDFGKGSGCGRGRDDRSYRHSDRGPQSDPRAPRMGLDGHGFCPARLDPLPGPSMPDSTHDGKWKVVIHTFGMKHLEQAVNSGAYFGGHRVASVRDYLKKAPQDRAFGAVVAGPGLCP